MFTTPLDTLRSGLHFSASALKTFLTCPWKFKLRYVEGEPPEFRPSSLILGSAVHEAIAVHHRGLQEHQAVKPDLVFDALDKTLEAGLSGETPVEFSGGENAGRLREQGRCLVQLYVRDAQPMTILAVEQPFQAELVDPRTGEVLEPNLVGVFDLVESDDEGTVSVVEIKTSARRWSAGQVDLDLQGSLYAEAVSQLGLVPEGQEALIRYEILVKNKKPVLDRQFAVRRPGDREMARMIAVDVLRAVERDAFFRNPGWACSGCQHRKACGI